MTRGEFMKIYLLANNVRSTYNVGSLFRLADAVGVTKLFLTGYTPYPKKENDTRPAYVSAKTDKELRKTGLEGIKNVPWEHYDMAVDAIKKLKGSGVKVVAIEQSPKSQDYLKYFADLSSRAETRDPVTKICFIVGHEREGVDGELLELADAVIEIPMRGKGKSLNVAMAATVVLYSLLSTQPTPSS